MRWLGAALAVAGCDDHVFQSGSSPAEGGAAGDGWCAVREVLSSCTGCHSAAGTAGGLDLETDPYAALVDAPSAAGDGIRVVPGDPDASVLVARLDGGGMPPTGDLDAPTVGVVREWIAAGAVGSCDGPAPAGGVDGMHPASWPDPGEHGIGAKFAVLACATGGCHGVDLAGDGGPGCASCHDAVVPDWTTSCTFCHGDRATGQPAPPQDIDDNDDPRTSSFPPHLAHVEDSDLHDGFGCETCHARPDDVFSAGHLQFGGDDTPGRAEVAFTGIAAGGSYGEGTCTVVCHDPIDGEDTVGKSDAVDCGDCHPVTADAWADEAGGHETHLDEDIGCATCHPTATDDAVVRPELHVDGAVALVLPGGITSTDGRCTGTCHGEPHHDRGWHD